MAVRECDDLYEKLVQGLVFRRATGRVLRSTRVIYIRSTAGYAVEKNMRRRRGLTGELLKQLPEGVRSRRQAYCMVTASSQIDGTSRKEEMTQNASQHMYTFLLYHRLAPSPPSCPLLFTLLKHANWTFVPSLKRLSVLLRLPSSSCNLTLAALSVFASST